jgi:hypothetical protein
LNRPFGNVPEPEIQLPEQLKRLDDQARRLERTAEGPSFESFVATERAASPLLDGRSVLGWEKDLTQPKAAGSSRSKISR